MSSAPDPLVSAMAASVSMVTSVDDVGATVGVATASATSYSIDPPSILVSVPVEFPQERRFGLSILTNAHAELARGLWEALAKVDGAGSHDGTPLIPGALASLVCEPALRTVIDDRALIVGEATAVIVGEGTPLLWWEGKVTYWGSGR